MKNTILKIIIVCSFIGIFVLVGVIYVKNRVVVDDAFNTITINRQSTKFLYISSNINNDVVLRTYEGEVDEYAVIIDNAVVEINAGIDYYLDFLVCHKNISRADQDSLINKYSGYVNKINETIVVLDHYKEVYVNAISNLSWRNQVPGASGSFSSVYNEAYQLGSDFLGKLIEVVNKYSYSTDVYYCGAEINIIVLKTLADDASIFLKNNTALLKSEGESACGALSACPSAVMFMAYSLNQVAVPTTQDISNANYRRYVEGMNKIDIKEILFNSTEYINSLEGESKTEAEYVKAYLLSTYSVEV